MSLVEVLIGAVAGAACAVPFLRAGNLTAIRASSFGLIVAAIIYLGFGLYGIATGLADLPWLVFETGGIIAYGSLGYLGLRKNGVYAAIGWVLHIVWDAGFHSEAEFVPYFYPGVCVGFDIVLALFTFYWSFTDNRE